EECVDAAPGEQGYPDCDEAQADPEPIFCCGDGICDAQAGENCSTCIDDCACPPGSSCAGNVCLPDSGDPCAYFCDQGTCVADGGNGPSCAPADPSKCPPCDG